MLGVPLVEGGSEPRDTGLAKRFRTIEKASAATAATVSCDGGVDFHADLKFKYSLNEPGGLSYFSRLSIINA